jgi:predicted  nucleic acid-binding Zn-ribbon protein
LISFAEVFYGLLLTHGRWPEPNGEEKMRAFEYASSRAATAENELDSLRAEIRQRDDRIDLLRDQMADLDRRVSAIERKGSDPSRSGLNVEGENK